MLVLLSGNITATASVELELAIHEAARTARREKIDRVLVVVRESSRSSRDQEIAGVLRAVEAMVLKSLSREDDVDGIVDRKVREFAAKTKARTEIRPEDVRRFTSLTDNDARTVLSLDYRNRGGIDLQVTLLDSTQVYFSESVELETRPDPLPEQDESTTDSADKKKTSAGKDEGKKTEKSKDDNPKKAAGAIKLAPGSESIKGTGGKVRRSKIESRNVRSTSQQQRQDKSVTDTVVVPVTAGKQTPRKPSGPITELQRDVVNFAADNIGRKIGRGECWDLADQALRAAGAAPPKGYTFGTPVPLDEIQPGDILQFTAARFDEPGYWTIMGMPNHTAVVHAVGDTRVFILQQNFDGKRYVTTYDLNLNNLTAGQLEAFRPEPAQ